MEIPKAKEFEKKVFAINNEKDFNSIALELYQFQYSHNPVYHDYCNAIRKPPDKVVEIRSIPFLPISFFKTHKVQTTAFEPELVFKSSGTTGMTASAHLLRSASLYRQSFMGAFRVFFGEVKDYCVLALLPSYLERAASSLVYMVEHLIIESGHINSGFYLYEHEKLDETVKKLEADSQPTLLFGVTYALLDFVKRFPQQLSSTKIIETGGMKGRGREITRNELYSQLRSGFGVEEIYSEYGMTELLSQAYAIDGIYRCPPWMKVLLRDETDPFHVYPFEPGHTGAINVIDLANIYSCCFIATDDIGKITHGHTFEVYGRMDHSDIRGCSLMVAR
jgi:phenylacetate-coenzyme A ligase PaaK-like adenylate-forming protein